MKRSIREQYRRYKRIAKEQGVELEGPCYGSGGHIRWFVRYKGQSQMLISSATPSCPRATKNCEKELERICQCLKQSSGQQ